MQLNNIKKRDLPETISNLEWTTKKYLENRLNPKWQKISKLLQMNPIEYYDEVNFLSKWEPGSSATTKNLLILCSIEELEFSDIINYLSLKYNFEPELYIQLEPEIYFQKNIGKHRPLEKPTKKLPTNVRDLQFKCKEHIEGMLRKNEGWKIIVEKFNPRVFIIDIKGFLDWFEDSSYGTTKNLIQFCEKHDQELLERIKMFYVV